MASESASASDPARRHAIHLTRAGGVAPLVAFRDRTDLPVSRHLHSPSTLLPLVQGARMWEETARLTEDPGVAFRVAAQAQLTEVPLGQLAARAATVGQALAVAARAASRFCGGQRLSIRKAGDAVCVERRFPDEVREGRRQANDFALLMILALVRQAAGADWRPPELHLEGPPPAHGEELAALAGTVHFGVGSDTVVVQRDLLGMPLSNGREPSHEAPPLPPLDFPASAREAVRALLRVRALTLPNLADVAGTSTRSLQRQLGEAGLTFAQLADAARYERAVDLLADPSVRVTDVAVELGYTDAANFTRAFRRWASVGPREFRRVAGAK